MRVYAHWVRPADRRAAELVAQELHHLRQNAAESSKDQLAQATALWAHKTKFQPVEALLRRPDPDTGPQTTKSPYLAIADEVRSAIHAGRLAPDDVLPPVQELAAWYGVSHGTAQRAIARLADEGLVILRRGARTRAVKFRASSTGTVASLDGPSSAVLE